MAYILSKKFTPAERQKVLADIHDFHRTNDDRRSKGLDNLTVNKLQRQLIDKGLGYRRGNLQHDIRRVESSYNAKTPEAKSNAKNWFDNVYEKFRSDRKLTSKEVSKIWQMAKDESWVTFEDEELGQEILDLYG